MHVAGNKICHLQHARPLFQVVRNQARLGKTGIKIIGNRHRLTQLETVVINQQRHISRRVLANVVLRLMLHDPDIHRIQVEIHFFQRQHNANAVGRGTVEKTVEIHLHHLHRNGAQALDAPFHEVALNNRTHTLGRAGIDEVTFLQMEIA